MPAERSTSTKRKPPAFKPPRPRSKPTEQSASPVARRKSAPSRPSNPLPQLGSDEEPEESFELPPPATEDPPPTIPPKLLTKLLHTHFDDDRTRISKDANAAVGKYFETFVREAIARAAFERAEAAGSGRGDGFLEVSGTFSR